MSLPRINPATGFTYHMEWPPVTHLDAESVTRTSRFGQPFDAVKLAGSASGSPCQATLGTVGRSRSKASPVAARF